MFKFKILTAQENNTEYFHIENFDFGGSINVIFLHIQVNPTSSKTWIIQTEVFLKI